MKVDSNYKVQSDARDASDFWKINIGHVGVAASALVGIALAWGSIKGKTDQHDAQFVDVKQSVEKLDAKLTKIDDKTNEANGLLRELAVVVKMEGQKTRANQNP